MKRKIAYLLTLLFLISSSAFSGSGSLTGVGGGGGGGGVVDDDHILWGIGPNQVSLDDIPNGLIIKLGQDASPTGTPTFSSIILTTGLGISSGGTGATDAAGARTNLGLGTVATQNSNAVSITGGSITGITDLAVADGGTGSSTQSGARSNLGAAASGANSDITSITGLTTPLGINQGGTAATDAAGARTNLGVAGSGSNSDITSLLGLIGPLQAPTGINDSNGNEVLKFGSSSFAVNEITFTNAATGNGPTLSATGNDTDIDLNLVPKGSGSVIIPDITISGGSISGITDLAVTDGGTGASDAATARANLSAAGSGINSDITELTGLTTPLSVGQGGTGTLMTPADGQLLIGKTDGTYAINTLSAGSNVSILNSDGGITISYSGLLPPFSDDQELIKGNVDNTKKVRFEVDGLTTSMTRVMTVPDTNGTLIVNSGGVTSLNSGQKIKRTPVSNTAYTALTTDYLISYTSISTTRVVSLPPAASLGDGGILIIKDESGSVSPGVKITLDPDGSETIDGVSTIDITAPYGALTVYSNGTNLFTL